MEEVIVHPGSAKNLSSPQSEDTPISQKNALITRMWSSLGRLLPLLFKLGHSCKSHGARETSKKDLMLWPSDVAAPLEVESPRF